MPAGSIKRVIKLNKTIEFWVRYRLVLEAKEEIWNIAGGKDVSTMEVWRETKYHSTGVQIFSSELDFPSCSPVYAYQGTANAPRLKGVTSA